MFVSFLFLLFCCQSHTDSVHFRFTILTFPLPLSKIKPFRLSSFHPFFGFQFFIRKKKLLKMIQLLFAVIFSEMAVIVTLSFKTPFRKLVLMSLDRVKRGRGPVMVKTVAATVFAVMMSSVYSMMKIQKRWIEDGAANPTDQVFMSKHLLEATLMGGTLFLGLLIDRLHHYIRELRIRRKSMDAVQKQAGRGSDGGSDNKVQALEEEVTTLRAKLKQLESDLETKTKEINAAEANTVSLRKQSEGFLLEYDRLLEENQTLRNQLQSLDQ